MSTPTPIPVVLTPAQAAALAAGTATLVISESATIPLVSVPLTAAQVTLLVAGTPVTTVTSSGASVTLQPPAGTVVTSPTTAPQLLVVFAQNGQTPNLPQDYSYDATDAHADTADGGDGNAACIKVTITGAWGGFQPSDNNGVVQNCSAATKIVVSLKPTKPNQRWSMQFLKGGDTPIMGSNGQPSSIMLPRSTDPTPVAGQWATYVIDKSQLTTDYSTGTATDVSSEIYKGAVQDQTGLAANVWYVDNWGFM